MFLLYLDESGNENDPTDRFFVLAGIALFERQIYFFSNELDDIQERYFPNYQPIPFHASEMLSGRGFWRQVPLEKRERILFDIASTILRSPATGRVLFAAAVEKSSALWGERAVEKATEEICRRFDIRLQRQYHERRDPQRGLLIFSQGRFDARAKIWVRGFHQRGTSWGAINNLADIPYFASSGESRLLQAADFVAHAVWRMYERRDCQLIGPLVRCFDEQDGTLHGLVHVRSDPKNPCSCPACYSRNFPGNLGPWIEQSTGAVS